MSNSANKAQKILIPLAFVGVMFFSLGFALGINSFLMPVLRNSLSATGAQSNLLLAATFLPFIIFGIPAVRCIELIGYKKTMAVSFALFAGAFGLFILAAHTSSFAWFLAASALSGTANCVLQASVNPYVTILGPLESAAQRISIMGICNKLAWPVTTLFITGVISKTIEEITLTDLTMPFLMIAGIFVVLGIIALMAPLPDVKPETVAAETADASTERPPMSSITKYPHLILGAIALFIYVGVETISLATATDYAKSIGLTGDNWGFIPSFGMIAGYLVGAFCIPRFISQVKAFQICAVVAVIGSVLVVVAPASISVWFIFLMALGCSLMWPALWPMAMTDLGNFTERGSSLLTMAIAGGAVMPWVRGLVEDALASFQLSFIVCIPCFLFILWYGFWGYKIRKS